MWSCRWETMTLANSHVRAQGMACAASVTCFWVQDGRIVALKLSLFMSIFLVVGADRGHL